MSKKIVTIAIAISLQTSAFSVTAEDQGQFYVGGSAGLVLGGNTRADGVFTSTGSAFDGQRLGPVPGETAKGQFDPSLTTNMTFGYDMGKRRYGQLRFEGELFYQKADTDKYRGELNGTELNPVGRVDTSMSGIVVNAIYGFGKSSRVTPFVYLGFGHANVDMSYNFPDRGTVKIDGSSEIIQGGFGVDYTYNERTTFDLKYRFRRAGLNDSGLDADIDAQSIEFGVRYAF